MACAELTTLRDLAPRLALVENPRTGNTLEYVVVGDGAADDQVLVFFPGTGGVLADWPAQMITNAAASPRIVDTAAYDPLQDGPVSLCHDHRLLLFDYAGVGDGTAAITQSFDSIASDVTALLDDAPARYGIATDDLSVIGWSLGTHAALKFALLSSVAAPARRIADVVLIATSPGGATDGLAIGNQAACVTTLLDELQQDDVARQFRTRLEEDGFKLTFPYVQQQPYDGADSGCTAEIDATSESISYSVTIAPCLPGTQCERMFVDQFANREIEPWSRTSGVPYDVYVNQRGFDHDWNVCWCARAGADFTSEDCTCSEPVELSSTNGGVCRCHVAPGEPETPVCASCVDLGIAGRITVLNGYEDMYIQWTYGRGLVDAYAARYGDGAATIVTYAGSEGAGHGVLLQHPGWTQQQIAVALGAGAASAR